MNNKKISLAVSLGLFISALTPLYAVSAQSENTTTPVISEYWCGPDVGCGGQSKNFADINNAANFVFVAFALVNNSGQPSFQFQTGYSAEQFTNDVANLHNSGKKVILSVGGQGADWAGALANPTTFASGIYSLLKQYNLDGVDLDIESASLATGQQAEQLVKVINTLRSQFNNTTDKHLYITVTPESTTVVNTVPMVGGGWNAMVPVIDEAIKNIDFIQIQEYNDNPYGGTPGSVDYLETIYKNWLKPFKVTDSANPQITSYTPPPASKLVMGVLASTDAGSQEYYPGPTNVTTAITDLKQAYSDFGGVMTWDSHWDANNNYTITNAFKSAL